MRTITTRLGRAESHAEPMHGRLFRNLQLLQVQLDELSRDPGDRRMRDPGRTTLRDKGHEVRV